MDKFKTRLPREDLKRFAKDVAKKLVNSDFKNKRVEDPTRISSKQERNVKKYVKEFFDKAVAKKREYENKKAKRAKEKAASAKEDAVEGAQSPPAEIAAAVPEDDKVEEESDGDQMMAISDDEDANGSPTVMPGSPSSRQGNGTMKRKRDDEDAEVATPANDAYGETGTSTPLEKRMKSADGSASPPPPPPPPPG